MTDAFGITGSGPKNSFKAKAPTIDFTATAPTDNFNATGANLSTTNYANAIQRAQAQSAGGGGPAAGTIARQNQLSDALTAAANGQGPSVAQEQLRQTTNQNINQTAGQIASQRGLNPALAARLAADSTGSLNQQASGQAATLRAQEQLAARDALASNLAATGQTQLAQQGAGTSALGTAGGLQNAQNTAAVQNALGAQGINAETARANQQANLAAQGMNQQTALANAQNQLSAQQINAGVSSQNAQTNSAVLGGMMQGVGAAMASLAHGGEVPRLKLAGGGPIWAKMVGKTMEEQGKHFSIPTMSAYENFAGPLPYADPNAIPNEWAPMYKQGGGGDGGGGGMGGLGSMLQGIGGGAGGGGGGAGAGAGSVAVAHGGEIDFRVGGRVPGRAPVAEGVDSEKADRVPAMLSSGEIVLPRSVAQAPDADRKAAEFVAAIKAKKGPDERGGYGAVLAANRALAQRVAHLERMAAGGEAGRKPKLGSGKRFEHLEHQLEGKGDIHDPGALAAAIGRKKFGGAKMSKLAAHGRVS